MQKRIVILIVALVTVLTGALPALAAADLDAALEYLSTQQNADGGFGGAARSVSSDRPIRARDR